MPDSSEEGVVHPTAVIHRATRLEPTVTVGPYAVIEDGVEIGAHTVIHAHAIVRSGTILGERCVVDSHAVIGGLPQDLRFDPRTPTGVRAGHRVVFREGVTVHRATKEGNFTEIGNEVFLMGNSHVGHDCKVGDHVILANGVLLAGFVTVGRYAFIGGAAAVHQFGRIGESAMVSGLSRASLDVPPFVMIAERDELIGLNIVGLKRRGFDRETIRELKTLFRTVLQGEASPRKLAAQARADGLGQTEAGKRFLEFFDGGTRGILRGRRRSQTETEGPATDSAPDE